MLTLPLGRGPFPAVIVLLEANPLGPDLFDWPHRLAGWGYASLAFKVAASHDPITEDDASSDTATGNGRDMGDGTVEVATAVAALRATSGIDPTRLAVLGHARGGATAAKAATRTFADLRLRAAVDYDGPCPEPGVDGGVPLLVLVGGTDGRGIPVARCRAYAAATGPGQVVEFHTYPGVARSLENWTLTDRARFRHVLGYDPQAVEDSVAWTRGFLNRWLAPVDAPRTE